MINFAGVSRARNAGSTRKISKPQSRARKSQHTFVGGVGQVAPWVTRRSVVQWYQDDDRSGSGIFGSFLRAEACMEL